MSSYLTYAFINRMTEVSTNSPEFGRDIPSPRALWAEEIGKTIFLKLSDVDEPYRFLKRRHINLTRRTDGFSLHTIFNELKPESRHKDGAVITHIGTSVDFTEGGLNRVAVRFYKPGELKKRVVSVADNPEERLTELEAGRPIKTTECHAPQAPGFVWALNSLPRDDQADVVQALLTLGKDMDIPEDMLQPSEHLIRLLEMRAASAHQPAESEV